MSDVFARLGIPVPSFVGIGPGKSGTSWIYEALKQHPDVCASDVKETQYFETQFHRGDEWYAQFFRHWSGESAIGEVSNTYIFSEEAPGRMAAFNPAMRIVTSLRNPADRAFSHYLFLKRGGRISGTFEEAIRDHAHIVERGFYHKLLNRYLDFFPRENIQVLLFDDLKADPVQYARKLYGFVGVDAEYASKIGSGVVLPASRARNVHVVRLAKAVSDRLREDGRAGLVARVKRSALMRMLFVPYAKGEAPKISADARRRLDDLYHDDIHKLSQMLDRDLVTEWLRGAQHPTPGA